jgi:hypothetical protein
MTEILQRLTAIETELRMIRENGLASCSTHTLRLGDLEARATKTENVVGRHGIVVLAFMAIGTGLAFAAKYLIQGGPK